MGRFRLSFMVSASLFVASIAFLGLYTPTAEALSGSSFQAGRIVDDPVFFESSSMTAQQIQEFLNSKLPTCDTNGTQSSGRWNDANNRYYTRAEWGTMNGYAPPYTCLKDYNQAVTATTADSYCAGQVGAGQKSAAQIIFDVSRACNVSPRALIVLLQKEQALVTDDWPWSIQYRSATGYGCPDTAACDSTYYGYFNQVYNAARQFQRYVKQANLFNYKAGQSSFVQYNPNSGCGGTNVYMNTPSTAALYNYTPYQPNQAALNNLYGTGDSCSAYGNRNFWRLFNDWFGSTYADKPITNIPWSFENLDGGQNGVNPRSDTTGMHSKAIQFGADLFVFKYNNTKRTLELSRAGTSGWVHSTIDGDSATGGKIAADVGKYTSATIYNNQLHLLYYNATNGTLRHAWYDNSSWAYETLDGTSASVSTQTANVGMTTNIAVFNGTLQAFYYDATNGNLRHAWYDQTRGWKFENLDGDYGSVGGYNSNLGQNAFAIQYNGSLQLFYYDVQRGTLRHAWVTTSQGWKFENLDGDAGSVARYSSFLGQDPSATVIGDSLQLFYYDVQRGNLRHAWVTTSQGWKFENLEGDAGSVSGIASDIGSMSSTTTLNGKLYVFYRQNSSGILRYAWTSPGVGWSFANLDGTGYSASGETNNTGFWPSSVPYGGSMQVYYFDNTQRSLRHTWGIPY